tara:strand:- start:4117 stop:4452 length:336 start_codon:yes stop_codon:yes gene_type:complete
MTYPESLIEKIRQDVDIFYDGLDDYWQSINPTDEIYERLKDHLDKLEIYVDEATERIEQTGTWAKNTIEQLESQNKILIDQLVKMEILTPKTIIIKKEDYEKNSTEKEKSR